MDLEDYNEPCGYCSAVSWSVTEEGRFYCTSCHTVIEVREVQTGDVITNARAQSISRGLRKGKNKFDKGWEWYICEGFQYILRKQAEALQSLGVSSQMKVFCSFLTNKKNQIVKYNRTKFGKTEQNKNQLLPTHTPTTAGHTSHLMGSIPLWVPQARWQNQVLSAFRNSINEGAILISGGIMFQRDGVTTEKALLGPTRCISLRCGTCSIPCLLALMGRIDVTGKRCFSDNLDPTQEGL
uniref:TATA box-binding protein-associated factor RNA polymerase I subunit B n=1 Tax=Pseudonaja textilis TaxID=8673 RepID=A0A670Z0E9_PSETE